MLQDAAVVSVEQGKLKGSIDKLLDGTPFYSFKGIPYAQPPIGNLRFKAPLPPLPWKDVYNATEHGPVCPQMDMITTKIITGDENCLFLNVYSKSLTDEKKPVIVYIHGGAYMSGSGNSDLYGPAHLVQHDIVLVTINYRLEVLGFLCLDTDDVPGNAGMKDQVAAMKWVKKNITSFGGDPDNITLMGESVGAASVSYHMVSPLSRNLFHKAIMHSGTCFHDWAKGTNSIDRAFRVAKLLGKDPKNTDELICFLRSVPAVDLAKVTFSTMDAQEKKCGLPMHFCPVVEKKFPNVESFLNEDSLHLYLAKKFQDIPLIIGYNNIEAAPMLNFFIKYLDVYDKELHLKLPREMFQRLNREQLNSFGEKLRMFYFNGNRISKEMTREMSSLDSDLFFTYNIHRFVSLYLSGAKSPVYMFRFGLESVLNIMKTVSGMTDFKGAVHADDLFYFFSSEMTKDLILESEDARDMVKEVTKLWTNFAKTGNPTPEGSTGIQWKPFTTSTKHFLNIEKPLSLQQNADKENIDFWNKLYCESGLPCITKSNL